MAPWTDELADKAIGLWCSGWSASQIAAQLKSGLTRNSVIGKLNRMKAPKRFRPVKPPRPVGRSRRARMEERRTVPPAFPAPPKLKAETRAPIAGVWTPLPGSSPVTLEHMTGCKWPVSDPFGPRGTPDLFCNCEPAPGSSYCPEHAQKAGGGFPVPRKTEPAHAKLAREMA